MKHMRQQLRESCTFRRVIGFADAVNDLGTHKICGTDAPYSRQMVYNVLYGRSGSKKLLARIVERRPDLLELSFVAEETKKLARAIGWKPRVKCRALAEIERKAGKIESISGDGAGIKKGENQ